MFGLVIGFVVLVYAIAAVIGLAGVIIGGVFSIFGSMVSAVFSGEGILLGIVIGMALYFWMKKRNTVEG